MVQINSYFLDVKESDLDFAKKPRFSALCNLILSVAGYDANARGFGVVSIGKDNHTWVISRMAVEWTRLPECFEKLEIKTWVSDVNRLMSTRNFEILDQAGFQIGFASTQWAMIDIASRQAVDLREFYTNFIVPLEVPITIMRRMPKVEAQKNLLHRVSYSDMDFNNHTNTLKYIDLMCDLMPIEWFEDNFIRRFDVHFLEEALYGQQLDVAYMADDSAAHFEIKNDNQRSICRACITL